MIKTLTLFQDNYCYFIMNKSYTAIVDPGDGEPVLQELKRNNIKPDFILLTHKHYDHTDGVDLLLKNYTELKVYTSKDKDILVKYGIDVKATPGHTMESCCFYIKDENALFTGDTLFVGLCGKVFEGDNNMMFESLQSLRELPDETKIFPGHEYLKYALTFMGKIGEKSSFYSSISKLENPSLHSTIKTEFENNIFLTDDFDRFNYLRNLKG